MTKSLSTMLLSLTKPAQLTSRSKKPSSVRRRSGTETDNCHDVSAKVKYGDLVAQHLIDMSYPPRGAAINEPKLPLMVVLRPQTDIRQAEATQHFSRYAVIRGRVKLPELLMFETIRETADGISQIFSLAMERETAIQVVSLLIGTLIICCIKPVSRLTAKAVVAVGQRATAALGPRLQRRSLERTLKLNRFWKSSNELARLQYVGMRIAITSIVLSVVLISMVSWIMLRTIEQSQQDDLQNTVKMLSLGKSAGMHVVNMLFIDTTSNAGLLVFFLGTTLLAVVSYLRAFFLTLEIAESSDDRLLLAAINELRTERGMLPLADLPSDT